MKMKKRTMYVLLAILILFHLVNNFIILKIDNIPFVYDLFNNYQHSIQNYAAFTRNPIKVFDLGNTHLSYHYPPLLYWSSLPLFLLFGINQDVAAMTNMIFFAVLILSTYGIGKMIRDEKTGLLAAFTVSMFPAIFGFSRVYTVDFIQTALIALTVYLLIKTENFRNSKYSILFGLAFGAGMLSKQTFPLYISAPLLILILSVKERGKDLWKNLFVSSLIAVIIFAPWYYLNIRNISSYALTNPYFKFMIEDLFVYIKSLYAYQLLLVYTIIFLLSLPLFLFLKKSLKPLVIAWLIAPVIIHTIFFEFKFSRYTLPVLPAISIIIALGIINLKRIDIVKLKRLYPYIMYLIVCVGIAQFFVLSYSSIEPIKSINEFHERFQEKGILNPKILPFNPEDIITSLNTLKDKELFVIEMADTPIVDMIEHEMYLQNFKLIIYSPYKTLDRGLQPEVIPKNYDFSEIFNKADVIITKDKGYFGSEDIPIDKETKDYYNTAYFEAFKADVDKFILTNTLPTGLDDDSSVLVYVRKGLL